MRVLSILISLTQVYHKPDKILKFAITKNANAFDNREDFKRVVMGIRAKVSGEQMFFGNEELKAID